jgi:DNA-binding CsgD family transcriptional regulator
MSPRDDYFAEYFTLAQVEALTDRESRMVELRYGLMGGDFHTLEQVGQEFGVSGERIRQIINRAHRKIRSRGRRQIKKGETGKPCAQLILYLESIIQPDETGDVERLVDFIVNDLSYLPSNTHALPLIASLIYPNQKSAKSRQEEARNRIREKARSERQSEKFKHLLSYVIWPNEVKLLTGDEISAVRRERNISTDGEGHSGSFFSEKMNRTVQYESQLELNFLLQLEQLEEVVFYQEQPFRIPYNHDGETWDYYPDLLFILSDGRGIVVEIKPVFKMALRENLTKWSALRKFCNDKGLGILVTDGRYSIQQVQRRDVDPGFEKAVLTSLQRGPLSWREYKEIRDKYDVNRNDFLALVLQNRLVWKLGPFTLSIR